MTKSNDFILEVKDLKKYFPVKKGAFRKTKKSVKAVDGVSFSIRRGETFGLVGESGSGKTTTGRLLLRAIEPTEGSIIYHLDKEYDLLSLDKNAMKEFRKRAQMIFQDPYSSLNPRMTVRDIIAEPLICAQDFDRKTITERVKSIAAKCQLNIEHLRRYPHAFSGGQRQRIGIARALVLMPDFVVCDEPVSALDVSIQAQILNLLKDFQEELGLTYLFIAHDLSVVEHTCDRIGVMYLGRLVELAETESLFYKPLHPYTEALMSAIPAANPDEVMRPVLLEGEIPSPINQPSGCSFHPRCRYAEELCKHERPEWREIEEGRFVACHYAEKLSLLGVDSYMNVNV